MSFIKHTPHYSFSSARGFSLVELMVAILIGLIILAGVVQVVLTSRTTFFAQEEMSYIQENARYALDVIGKDIQGAGYWGCAGQGAGMAAVAQVTPDAADLFGINPVNGFEGDTGANAFPAAYREIIRPVTEVGGTGTQDHPDMIITRRATGVPQSVENHNGQTITLANTHSFDEGDYLTLVAEDCERVGFIRASAAEGDEIQYSNTSVCGNVIKPALGQRISCPAGGNGLVQSYLPGSVVMEYSAHGYYVGSSSALADQPALKRVVLTNGGTREEELAMGVEDLEVVYGVSIDDDPQVERYINADDVTDWSQVVSVQISLLFRGQTPSLDNAQEREFLGNDYNDRFMRQLVTATYRLRNRI